jgi:hypothetical protein
LLLGTQARRERHEVQRRRENKQLDCPIGQFLASPVHMSTR